MQIKELIEQGIFSWKFYFFVVAERTSRSMQKTQKTPLLPMNDASAIRNGELAILQIPLSPEKFS